jgi:hypothetical protein
MQKVNRRNGKNNPDPKSNSCRDVARLVLRCLKEGKSVEIDGLGVFRPDGRGGYDFTAETRPQVFLAYAAEDLPYVGKLNDALETRGFEPWVDKRKLLPGQNWPRAIERAIEASRFFVACLSHRSVSKRGRFHAEMRYALDCASMQPLGETYFMPVRLDECEVPVEIQRSYQYLDLFPDWDKGVQHLIQVMREQERRDRRRIPPAAA